MSAWPKRGGRTAGPMARPVAPMPTAKAAKLPLKIEGDAALWTTLQRVTDPATGWVKTTRAMPTPAGVLINTCSRRHGSTVAAEALVLVPGTRLQGARVVAL
jgi:hypothetical protein